jgi:hypothetical protein
LNFIGDFPERVFEMTAEEIRALARPPALGKLETEGDVLIAQIVVMAEIAAQLAELNYGLSGALKIACTQLAELRGEIGSLNEKVIDLISATDGAPEICEVSSDGPIGG